IGILMAIAIPTFLGAQKSAQDRSAQSDLRNLLTSEVSYYTSNQSYATAAQLAGEDPSYTQQLTGTTPTIKVSVVAASGTAPDAVCISEVSKTGTLWGIEAVSSGSNAGTWYYQDTTAGTWTCSASPAASTTNPLMSQQASAVGF
ncbi:MAG: type IV pilin protein, partial [Acidimicrobiales bacterium]